jgi:predicted SprT family Zn-dependent metalloprotease
MSDRQRNSRRISSPTNMDLFEATPGSYSANELPSVRELQRMFTTYNKVYFDGKLPRVKIVYSKRLTSAGIYYPHKREIRISEKYHRIFPEEVYDTLKHEMIHIIHLKHNAAFKAIANRIGASLRANSHPALQRPPKYVYVCPECRTEYPRQRRLRNASCGKCSRHGYDKRFKLILKKNLQQAARQ